MKILSLPCFFCSLFFFKCEILLVLACLWPVWQATTSMVRLVFSKPQKTLKDIYFDADKQSIA
jgi:hypothetical protein